MNRHNEQTVSASYGALSHSDPRETMRALPDCLQVLLTFLTGKPLEGQRALNLTPHHHVISSFGAVILGVTTGAFACSLAGGWWVLLPLSWVLTLFGMRNLRMMIFHQAAHANLYGRSSIDDFIGKMIASLLIIQSFKRYSDDHRLDHHGAAHMTLRDPTVQALLIGLGLRCGMSMDEMWRRVFLKAISPVFHIRFAWGRFRSFFKGSSITERAAFTVFYGGTISLVALEGAWSEFILLWLVPLFPMFQISNVFRLCVKHTFPAADSNVRSGRGHIASLSNAIFIGEAAPVGSVGFTSVLRWIIWCLRMLTIHLPVRLLVLTGDTVVHDYHHRHPRTRAWAKYLFLRQQDMQEGHKGWPPYRQVWGLAEGMKIVFASLANADATEFNVKNIAAVSDRELFEAFED